MLWGTASDGRRGGGRGNEKMVQQSVSAHGMDAAEFAVTTRSRLKSPRLFLPMLHANLDIKRQLAATSGCLRFASVVMGPRDFWTISVWRSRDEMLEFMQGGAHERLMWNIAKWFDSFWLMRWAPTADQEGSWDGLRFREVAGRGATSDPAQREAAKEVLASIPEFLAAIGPEGGPSYHSAPTVRRSKERVDWANAGILRLHVPTSSRLPVAWRRIRSVRNQLARDPDVLRVAYGAAGPEELFAFAIFGNEEAWRRFKEGSLVRQLMETWPETLWIMRWTAEHEFGHWDRLRVRRVPTPPATSALPNAPG